MCLVFCQLISTLYLTLIVELVIKINIFDTRPLDLVLYDFN
jgi:hypothetical protein